MIRVLVVDDSKLVYEGLRVMFASDNDIDIFGFAQNGKEAIEQISNDEPNVVLIDVLMPVMGGIETTRQISKLFPEVKVIVLSSFEDDPMILEAIAAGAKGYLLKNMIAKDLSSAVRTVNRGCSHFAPGIIDSLAKNVLESSKLADTNKSLRDKAKAVKNRKAKPKLPKPLFRYGDWVSIILAVIILYQIDGINLYLAHLGLFCLMLSLLARPICGWWSWPFKNRRLIGISAFALSVVHAAYMFNHSLHWNLHAIAFMLPQHRWGINTGILSLFLLFPAAITSSQFFQRKLGNKWRQIHLLTVPALTLAISHIILIGSHYMGAFDTETVNYVRTFGLITAGLLVLLIRRKISGSVFKLNSVSSHGN